MLESFRFAGDLFPELARLQQHLDEVFQSAGPSNIRALTRGGFPAVNVGISPGTIEVLVFAPGIDPQQVQITIDRGLLTIAGERKAESVTGKESETVYARERFTGAFRRIVSLPEDADPSKVDARFRDGLLHITVHKRESSKPRQITVS